MLVKCIIFCLDIKDGCIVKGVNFVNLCDVGDFVELGVFYSEQGADELVFLDIIVMYEKCKILVVLVYDIVEYLSIFFIIGGGIKFVEDVDVFLVFGVDKIFINFVVVCNLQLIEDFVKCFGSQFVVVVVDVKFIDGDWFVYFNGGWFVIEI